MLAIARASEFVLYAVVAAVTLGLSVCSLPVSRAAAAGAARLPPGGSGRGRSVAAGSARAVARGRYLRTVWV
jgi:hypothetical protein